VANELELLEAEATRLWLLSTELQQQVTQPGERFIIYSHQSCASYMGCWLLLLLTVMRCTLHKLTIIMQRMPLTPNKSTRARQGKTVRPNAFQGSSTNLFDINCGKWAAAQAL